MRKWRTLEHLKSRSNRTTFSVAIDSRRTIHAMLCIMRKMICIEMDDHRSGIIFFTAFQSLGCKAFWTSSLSSH